MGATVLRMPRRLFCTVRLPELLTSTDNGGEPELECHCMMMNQPLRGLGKSFGNRIDHSNQRSSPSWAQAPPQLATSARSPPAIESPGCTVHLTAFLPAQWPGISVALLLPPNELPEP